MKYIVIDPDGQLYQRSAPRYDVALRDVGPEGWARVNMSRAVRSTGQPVQVAGFVNDCGLLAPDRYPRNPVGTCVLASLGASVQPYAGPVVLTGWDPYADDVEIRSLTEVQIAGTRQIHADVRRVLALDEGEPTGDAPRGWRLAMHRVAELARSAPTPEVRIIDDPEEIREVLARLRAEG